MKIAVLTALIALSCHVRAEKLAPDWQDHAPVYSAMLKLSEAAPNRNIVWEGPDEICVINTMTGLSINCQTLGQAEHEFLEDNHF